MHNITINFTRIMSNESRMVVCDQRPKSILFLGVKRTKNRENKVSGYMQIIEIMCHFSQKKNLTLSIYKMASIVMSVVHVNIKYS